MHVKAMVVFQGASGLPEDRFINNLHFDVTSADLPSSVAVIHTDLVDFYNVVPTGGTKSIGSMISGYVNRPFTIRYYDMADPLPRVPHLESATLVAVDSGSTGGLPEEVAIVCSFHAGPPITPRRRGRIYIGPLNTTAIDLGDTGSPARIDTARRNVMCGAMKDLAESDAGWCVYSPTADTLEPVLGGWCDDAPDTQRRRGVKESTRATWTLP